MGSNAALVHGRHFRSKIDLGARAGRIEHGRVRVGDAIEFVSLDRLPGAAPFERAQRLDAAVAHLEHEIVAPAGFGEREARRGEQALGRRRLENPANALLRLDDRDRRIAIIAHQRGERVALGQHIGGALGLGAGVEVEREIAKALEARGRIGCAERQKAGLRLNEGESHEGEAERRRPERRFGDRGLPAWPVGARLATQSPARMAQAGKSGASQLPCTRSCRECRRK